MCFMTFWRPLSGSGTRRSLDSNAQSKPVLQRTTTQRRAGSCMLFARFFCRKCLPVCKRADAVKIVRNSAKCPFRRVIADVNGINDLVLQSRIGLKRHICFPPVQTSVLTLSHPYQIASASQCGFFHTDFRRRQIRPAAWHGAGSRIQLRFRILIEPRAGRAACHSRRSIRGFGEFPRRIDAACGAGRTGGSPLQAYRRSAASVSSSGSAFSLS